ncbi:Mrp/NBP35 family ATP-binding protein [Desulfitobacterium sp.]|uniref:Mrp/NBP35 family ATP-binding protein n=1 Tax=Desulfitobacterium sp. TaxID=49981 RepID=UPI002B1F8699|nr:Mrp/NBP35 family ATP-binding protein [Desulfitobacterium sp.]MEA4901203.1 Mrp/NBP35 family ATP-binding protein [Desulfitobacterium sp.]
MSEACSSCSAAGSCSGESCSAEHQLTEAQKASKIGKIIAVMSGKGGVGKSSVTSMLAVSLKRQGYKVGILDADITGPSIPKIFGIKEKANVNKIGVTAPESKDGIKVMSLNLMLENEDDPVVWRGAIITQLVQQFWTDVVWGELDYLLIDMPPGTGDVPITIFQSLPINGVVMVTSPQQLAGMIVRKAIKMVKKYDLTFYGLIENMAYVTCPDCNKKIEVFGTPKGEEEASKNEIPYLGQLPLDPVLSSMSDLGKIEDYQTADFEEIVKKMIVEAAKEAAKDNQAKSEDAAK